MDMNNTAIKSIIDEHINRTLGKVEEREDIDFVDIFYPMIETICGLDICLDIHNNKNVEDKLKKRGMTVSLFNRFEEMLQNGVNYYTNNSGSLESLKEIYDAYKDFLKSYAVLIRDKFKANGKEKEVEKKEVAVRSRKEGDIGTMIVKDYEQKLLKEIENKSK